MKRVLQVAIGCLLGSSLLAQESGQRDPGDAEAFARAGGDLVSQTPEEELLRRPAPRLADGTPDLSGVWIGSGPILDIRLGLLPGEEIALLPWAQELKDSRLAKDDPEANCLPTGVPRIAPYPFRIVQAPMSGPATHLYFLFEGNIHSYRQIFMDGRGHPPAEELDPTWYGHSIGRWEGDTLVVDTVGFNDRFWFDFQGHPHTERLHTIERYTRTNYGTLEKVVTIIDPGAYEKPFTIRFDATLRPGWELMEYVCNENNQDVQHITGPASSTPAD